MFRSELEIDAGGVAHRARVDDRNGCADRAEVQIEVLHLDRPLPPRGPFDTAAGGPAALGGGAAPDSSTEGLSVIVAEGVAGAKVRDRETAGGKDQYRVEGPAQAAARREQPPGVEGRCDCKSAAGHPWKETEGIAGAGLSREFEIERLDIELDAE